MRSGLERFEQFFRVSDAGACVVEPDHHQFALESRRDAQFPPRAMRQNALDISCQIDEHLQQPLMIGLDQGQVLRQVPRHIDRGFP